MIHLLEPIIVTICVLVACHYNVMCIELKKEITDLQIILTAKLAKIEEYEDQERHIDEQREIANDGNY